MEIPPLLESMLRGERGQAKQMGARLVLDMADTAGAESLIPAVHAHVSGVSVITGGPGLRRFLSEIANTGDQVSIPTTLNSAGCDRQKIEEMGIDYPSFLELQFEIIKAYESLGIEATLSCTPYDRGIEAESGAVSWAESNAVAFANSWTDLVTNRESGLSALATALTGFAPKWGLHLEENRRPNIHVNVTAQLERLSDFSILGDWIGKQIKADWKLPFGPMPYISGLSKNLSFGQRKALTAAAANYGCPMLWTDENAFSSPKEQIPNQLIFSDDSLNSRYEELSPKSKVDLVVIGCPQASLEEIRHTAAAVRTHLEFGKVIKENRLWVFTSGYNYELASADGSIDLLEQAGVLILQDTCPEVTPYNRNLYNHLLTNSLKAEHYLTSGLNRIPTSVSNIETCVRHAFDEHLLEERIVTSSKKKETYYDSNKSWVNEPYHSKGNGLKSQTSFEISGKALVTDIPITFLGYVNPLTGVIEEEGHPLDGQAIGDTILIFPKGSGSTVAPYVLMGLVYENKGPKAIITRDLCSLTLPACSLLELPYAHGFTQDPCMNINSGDEVRMIKNGEDIQLEVLQRVTST